VARRSREDWVSVGAEGGRAAHGGPSTPRRPETVSPLAVRGAGVLTRLPLRSDASDFILSVNVGRRLSRRVRRRGTPRALYTRRRVG
jgi:hypothetical protein